MDFVGFRFISSNAGIVKSPHYTQSDLTYTSKRTRMYLIRTSSNFVAGTETALSVTGGANHRAAGPDEFPRLLVLLPALVLLLPALLLLPVLLLLSLPQWTALGCVRQSLTVLSPEQVTIEP